MRKVSLLALSAIPGSILAYALLTGILMNRVKPLPIVKMPEHRRSAARTPRQPAAV